MTLPVNYQQQPIPNHSGITINISNPVMNPPGCCSHPQCPHMTNPNIPLNLPAQNQYNNGYAQQNFPAIQQGYQVTQPQPQVTYYNDSYPQTINQYGNNGYANTPQQQAQNTSYPPQYYMNNYNYINTPQNTPINQPTYSEDSNPEQNNMENIQKEVPELAMNNEPVDKKISPELQTDSNQETKEADLSLSKEIINNLDEQKAAREEATKNEQKVKVVALTNEYIMSLEDYLNNPNNDIRYTAAKEILTRLDEDRSRHNDAALNALLNKMLQDPDKSIRVAAMSAFASELASGNEYTVKLLKDIQNNPNADKDDVVEAANILLKMTASTEYKYVPMNNDNPEQQPQVVQ